VKRTSFRDRRCSIAQTLEIVGEWWTLLIVRDALRGLRRFEDFQESLEIARNVLASRLRTLVDRGVLERRRYQERPSRYEYVLTEKGADLFPVIIALMQWGDRWASKKGPPVLLYDRATDQPVEPVLVDGRTGRKIERGSLRPKPGPGADAKLRRSMEQRRDS
jgi:DNA-binding HxlR family transcriptional regulator